MADAMNLTAKKNIGVVATSADLENNQPVAANKVTATSNKFACSCEVGLSLILIY
jgi:hypothetical protein